jgi:exodeoxyribonuclease V alpha subunit
MMLWRNLLYTAITRATKLAVLAGSRHALAAAVRTPGAGRRQVGTRQKAGGRQADGRRRCPC